MVFRRTVKTKIWTPGKPGHQEADNELRLASAEDPSSANSQNMFRELDQNQILALF
jgi:hypothetical protein